MKWLPRAAGKSGGSLRHRKMPSIRRILPVRGLSAGVRAQWTLIPMPTGTSSRQEALPLESEISMMFTNKRNVPPTDRQWIKQPGSEACGGGPRHLKGGFSMCLHTNSLTSSSIAGFGAAPTCCFTSSPLLNTKRVGMLTMLYSEARST